jgi:hypothetical protein
VGQLSHALVALPGFLCDYRLFLLTAVRLKGTYGLRRSNSPVLGDEVGRRKQLSAPATVKADNPVASPMSM